MDIVDAELIWPGAFIDHDDAEASHQAEGLLLTLDNSFVEALLALLCFEEARSARSADLDDWERRSRERTECEGQAWGDRVPPESESSWEAMMAALDERRLAGERLLMRRMLERGELPQSISHHLPFMYARSFVFALDTIDKVLKVLEVHPVPTAAKQARAALEAALPGLRDVRDTAHHHEDRVRGLGRHGQQLDLQPVDVPGFISSPNGAIILNSLNGTSYGCTSSNGHYVEIDVTLESLIAARDAIQRVLDSIKWRDHGTSRRSPHV